MKKAVLYIALLFIFWNSYSQNTDSLKTVLDRTEGKNRIEVLHQLVLSVWLNYPDQAMLYGLEALELSKKFNDQYNVSKSIRLLAGVDYYKGDFESSLERNLEALEIAESIGDSSLINNGLNNIGLLYYNLGSYQTALEYLLRSLKMKKRSGEVYGLGTTLNNIGMVYDKVNDYNMARKYFFDALAIGHSTDNNDIIVYSQNNIGLTYLRQENLVAARQYFEKALGLAESIENINWGSVSLRGIGEVLRRKGIYDSARYYYIRSLNASESIDDKKGIAEAYYMLSMLAQDESDTDSAIDYLTKSHKMAHRLGSRQQLLDNLQHYIAIYSSINDNEKVIFYQSAYANLRDSLFQDVVNRNLSLIPIKIEQEEDRVKLAQQQVQIERQTFINLLLIGFALIMTPLVIILFTLMRKNRAKNELLMERNTEILSQKEEIETQKEVLVENNKELERAKDLIEEQKRELEELNKELSKTVDKRTSELKQVNEELRVTNLELDNLIYKSSHDIRGPLVRLMGVCNLALMEVKEEKAIEFFKMLDKAAKRLNNTVDKLKIVSELSRKQIVHERIDFLSLIQHNLDQNKYIEGLKDVEIDTEIQEGLIFHSDPSVIDLIIFNMLQNSVQLLKGAKLPSKRLKVGIGKHEDYLNMTFDIEDIELVVSDNGGFFKMLAKDDDEHQNVGIGLYTVKQCVQKLGGELLLQGDTVKATRFSINLPFQTK